MDNLYARLGYTLLLVLNYPFLHHQSHFSRIAFTITRRNTLSSIIAHIGRLENHSTFITTGLKTRNKSICINLALCFVFVFVLVRLSMVSYLLFPKQDNQWACKSVNEGVKRVGHVRNFEQNWLFNFELILFTFSDEMRFSSFVPVYCNKSRGCNLTRITCTFLAE